MSRRTTGTFLIGISAILYATRYLTAAIFGSGMMGWNQENFRALLYYVGTDLVIWGMVALVFGVVYILWAEIDAFRISKKEPNSQ
jgi:hypothetical protein